MLIEETVRYNVMIPVKRPNMHGIIVSVFSSSANAYMLMYRQIRTEFTSEDDLPQHVKKLVKRLQKDEFKEKEERNYKRSICKVRTMTIAIISLYCT